MLRRVLARNFVHRPLKGGLGGCYRAHHAASTSHHEPIIRIRNRSLSPSTTFQDCSSSSCGSSSGSGNNNFHQLPRDKALTWYACGPTVYDSAHLGHARTYVATDIIRRIITDHFGHTIEFAMGITDIDDKIINRCKEQGLGNGNTTTGYREGGFESFASNFEYDFFSDMDQLQVKRPDVVLRVTEHIPEIIDFIERLLSRGYAYVTQDGVYFNIDKLPESYQYDRFGCVPPVAEIESQENSTYNIVTNLSSGDTDVNLPKTKKDPRDFALWKRAPLTDPAWESPWGRGRPGWHIECSTMTTAYFGEDLDIHSGGIDLQFPHHTNEIAQSECHHGHSWVKAWIHTGHLHIEGRKMSKSLKNFISIQDYFNMKLTSSPADDFRLFCLLHKYDATLTFAVDRIKDAASFRLKCESFWRLNETMVKQLEQTSSNRRISRKATNTSRALQKKLQSAKQGVNEALANDFDTPQALSILNSLVGDAMQYALLVNSGDGSVTESQPIEPLFAIEEYVRKVLINFGLRFSSRSPISTRQEGDNSYASGSDEAIQAVVDLRSKFRAISTSGLKAVKSMQKQQQSEAESSESYKQLVINQCKETLKLTDQARDELGAKFNIVIEDLGSGGSTWRKK